MNKKINPRLIELARKTCNPDLKTDSSILEQKIKEEQNLKRDEHGKPILNLTPLEETSVNTLTQEEYNTLMQVYECGGWIWNNGDKPTIKNYWKVEGEETCIDAGIHYHKKIKGIFGYTDKSSYQECGWKIISTQEFYNIQNITQEIINEINAYYKK